MLSCYVASTRLLISRTVIDAPLNYSIIRIDILHFPRRVEQGTWLRCWWLLPRRMTFLMLWRANNWGEVGGSAFCWKRKGPRKETKIEKPFLKSKWTIFDQKEQFSLKFTHSQIKMTARMTFWCCGANTLGGKGCVRSVEREKDREKRQAFSLTIQSKWTILTQIYTFSNQNDPSQIISAFCLMTWHLIPYLWGWVWVVGHSALHFPTQYPRWAVRHSLPTISPVWVYAGLLKEEKREAIQSLWERTGGLVLTTTTTTFTKKIQIHLLVSFSPIGYYHIPITIPQIPRERVNSLFVN